VTAADLNGDGKMDAILGYDLDGIAVLLGNGDGTLQPPVNYDTTGLGNDVIIVSDLNLDGKLDLAVPSSLGTGPNVGVDIFWGNEPGAPTSGYSCNMILLHRLLQMRCLLLE
jgi:hypothetical protein